MNIEEIAAVFDELDLLEADVFILPPENPLLSDEDSGEENDADITHFTGNQLRGGAEMRAKQLTDECIVNLEILTKQDIIDKVGDTCLASNISQPKDGSTAIIPSTSTSTSQLSQSFCSTPIIEPTQSGTENDKPPSKLKKIKAQLDNTDKIGDTCLVSNILQPKDCSMAIISSTPASMPQLTQAGCSTQAISSPHASKSKPIQSDFENNEPSSIKNKRKTKAGTPSNAPKKNKVQQKNKKTN